MQFTTEAPNGLPTSCQMLFMGPRPTGVFGCGRMCRVEQPERGVLSAKPMRPETLLAPCMPRPCDRQLLCCVPRNLTPSLETFPCQIPGLNPPLCRRGVEIARQLKEESGPKLSFNLLNLSEVS